MSAVNVVMIDNYDSFTYNLVQYFGELGADVTVLRNDQVSVDEIAALNPDKIVISPGPCTPKEAGISVAGNRKIRRTHSHFGRMPGTSKHRLRLRRQHHPCQKHHARQNLTGLSSK